MVAVSSSTVCRSRSLAEINGITDVAEDFAQHDLLSTSKHHHHHQKLRNVSMSCRYGGRYFAKRRRDIVIKTDLVAEHWD